MQALTTTMGWVVFLSAACCLLIFPFLAIFRRTRPAAGYGYIASSYAIGFSLWIMCFLTVFDLWGLGWALTGIMLVGVGVLPMALIALGWTSQWALVVEIIVIGAIVYGIRALGFWLAEKR